MLLEFANGRRNRHTDSLEDLAACPEALAPYGKALPALLDYGLLQRFEILFDVRPLERVPRLIGKRPENYTVIIKSASSSVVMF